MVNSSRYPNKVLHKYLIISCYSYLTPFLKWIVNNLWSEKNSEWDIWIVQMVCVMRTMSVHACHYVKDHEQPTQWTVQSYGYIRVLRYICLNIKPKLKSKGKWIVYISCYMNYFYLVLILHHLKFSITSKGKKVTVILIQKKRSWYITGTKTISDVFPYLWDGFFSNEMDSIIEMRWILF